jgi:hypothetical protein
MLVDSVYRNDDVREIYSYRGRKLVRTKEGGSDGQGGG